MVLDINKIFVNVNYVFSTFSPPSSSTKWEGTFPRSRLALLKTRMGGLRRTGGSQAPTLVPLPICPILPDTLFYFLLSLQYTSYTWQEKVYHRPVKNSRSWQLVTQSVWVGKARKRFRFQTSWVQGGLRDTLFVVRGKGETCGAFCR